MGYMTEISILNDRWDEIRKSPEKFVDQIYTSSMSNGCEPSWIIGQTTVARTHHANDMRVYMAYGNSFVEAYPESSYDLRRLLLHQEFLESMSRYLKQCETATELLIAQYEEETRS